MSTIDSDLETVLDSARKTVKTDSYPMSIGELSGMYEAGEIILRPEYQRYFRWTDDQKTKLIESILIGLPLPSVFVAQDDDGNWEVVDGMQRLSTIFDFMGVISDDVKKSAYYKKFDKLSDDLFYIEKFQGKSWNDLTRRIQLDFRRTKLQLTILLRETGPDAKFELFQRLNSGGTAISGQELRNAIMAGRNPDVLAWFETLSQHQSFTKVCALSERDISERMDVELVLRFIAFLSPDLSGLANAKSVDVYLTSVLRTLLDDDNFDFGHIEYLFKRTFDTILNCWGENALKYKNGPGTGKFSISFFETVALGLAQNIDRLPSKSEIKRTIDAVGDNPKFRSASGSGKNARRRIPELVKLGRNAFKAK